MSEKPISKGDLVMIVKGMPCCGKVTMLGAPQTVVGFDGVCICVHCGAANITLTAQFDNGYWGRPLSTLIRIDPPALSEDTRTGEELTA